MAKLSTYTQSVGIFAVFHMMSTGKSRCYSQSYSQKLHLFDEFGHGGDAGVDLLAEGGYAVFAALDAQAQDGLLQNGILVVFFVKESISHLL